MALTWSSTCTLLEGQTATAYAEVEMSGTDDVLVRLTVVDPELVINCTRSQKRFLCEHDGVEQMVSVCERMMGTGAEQRFSIQVVFKALVDSTSSATFDLIAGDGDIQNASLTVN